MKGHPEGKQFQDYKGRTLITAQRGAGPRVLGWLMMEEIEKVYPGIFALITEVFLDTRKTGQEVQFRCLGRHGIGDLAGWFESSEAGVEFACRVKALTGVRVVWITAGYPDAVMLVPKDAEYQAWKEVQWAIQEATE